jgi:hypothetical protein
VNTQFKLISSNNFDLFEERLNEFVAGLSSDVLIVDVKFSTAALSSSVEYSALVHFQQTEGWQ